MATISVPLSAELEHSLDTLVAEGVGSNRADVMRRALTRLAEEEAVQAILDAQREPTLHGDLDDLLKKVR
jgi:Arc/MetJ-type ribon-helix-helix transcriptional regulator